MSNPPGPSPAPGPTPPSSGGAQSKLAASVKAGIQLPSSSGGSASRYGLGENATDPVTLGGGFGPIPELGTNPTAEDVMKWFATLPSGDPRLTQIQAWLLKSGRFYPAGTTAAEVDFGVLGPKDIAAMADAVRTAGQTGADLSDFLQRSAAWGVYQGVTGAVSAKHSGGGASGGSALTLDVADPKALGVTIDAEYLRMTGRKPTASERAGFIAAFTNASKQLQIDNYKRANGLDGGVAPSGPGAFSAAPPNLSPTINDPTALMIGGGIPQQINQGITAANQAATARDNALLALANQPFANAGAQPGSYGAGGSGVSGIATVTQQDNYDPTAWAQEYVNQHSGAEAGAHSVSDTFDQFLSILKGGV